MDGVTQKSDYKLNPRIYLHHWLELFGIASPKIYYVKHLTNFY